MVYLYSTMDMHVVVCKVAETHSVLNVPKIDEFYESEMLHWYRAEGVTVLQ